MPEDYPKNSLLGQLEIKGLINESSTKAQCLPFGILTGSTEVSPFLCSMPEDTPKQTKIMKKRLNDLDNNIFQEGNFVNIDDAELSREEKAAKIRHLVKKYDEKIFMLEDSDDEILLKKLNDEREALRRTLSLLTEEAPAAEIASKIQLKEKLATIESYVYRFCPILRKNFLVRHALNKLVMLNENAKELLSKKIPYGEQEGRYSDFIACLSCANIIHAKLTKKM